MKLKVLLSILTIGAVLFSSNTLTAQSITPNTFILQPYIGAPNMKKWIYDTEYQEGNKSSGFGHVGLSGELTVSERFGIGFDAIYSPFSRESVETISEYDSNTDTYTTHNEVRAFDEDKLRLIAKVYIHFNVENPKWDIYISGGVGANIIFAKAYIDGVETDYQSPSLTTQVYRFTILHSLFQAVFVLERDTSSLIISVLTLKQVLVDLHFHLV